MIFKHIKGFFTSWIAVFLFAVLISTSCNKDNNNNIDFTIDITQQQFSQLQNLGGSVVYNGIIIAYTALPYTYSAVSAYCTVDNDVLSYNASQSYFVCPLNHTFNTAGTCTDDPGAPPLIVYHTNLTNNTLLQIYSN
jgi:hypothetical protein